MFRVWRVPAGVRRRVVLLRLEGAGYREIQAATGVSAGTVANVLAAAGCRGRVERHVVAGRLSLEDRVEIRVGIERGESGAQIGRRLGWAASTVTREIARHSTGGRDGYRPFEAHRRACANAHRVKPTKLGSDAVLLALVTAWLERWWSPQQIAQTVTRGVSRPAGDVGVTRNDLQVAVRARPWGAAPRVGSLFAERSRETPFDQGGMDDRQDR